MKSVCMILVFCAGCVAVPRTVNNANMDRSSERVMQLVRQHDDKEFANCLSNLPPQQCAEAIVQWWKVNGAEYRPSPQAKACYFLEAMNSTGEAELPVLRSAMSDGSDEVRYGASCALLWVSPEQAYTLFEDLLKGLDDSDWRVREMCTLTISRFGYRSQRAIPLYD